jgi:co-chaperonin GroES (HSP10)
MSTRVRPLSGQVLVQVLPPETRSAGGIEFPQVSLSAEEVSIRNRAPTPLPPQIGIVEAIGPWPRLKNGLQVLPPFVVGAKVVFRPGSGQDCARGIGERLKLIRIRDLLAVLT